MELAYDRTGSGPPLVLLHPLGADRRIWDPVVPLLSQSHEVVAVDLPGFGASPPITGTVPTPAVLAGAVADTLTALGLQAPHVAGNSLGGWVALELGLSGAASGVTGIAPAGLWAQPLEPKSGITHTLARAFGPLIGPATRTLAGRRLLLAGSVLHPERVPAAQAAHLIHAYGRASDWRAVNDAMRARRFEGLARIQCPVTLIWPDHDRLITRPESIPAPVHNVVLPDSGHIPIWDAPVELARLLAQAADRRTAQAGQITGVGPEPVNVAATSANSAASAPPSRSM